MMTQVIILAAIMVWVLMNLVVASTFTISDMRRNFICGQCFVGKVFANLFYSLAWALKAVKLALIIIIA